MVEEHTCDTLFRDLFKVFNSCLQPMHMTILQ